MRGVKRRYGLKKPVSSSEKYLYSYVLLMEKLESTSIVEQVQPV